MSRKFYLLGVSVELLILLALLSSCMKEPDYKQDFGDEVSWDNVRDAILTTNKPSPTTTRLHEFGYMEISQKIEDLQNTVVGQRSYELTEVTEQNETVTWNVLRQVGELHDGQMKISKWDDELSFCKPEFPHCGESSVMSTPAAIASLKIDAEQVRASAIHVSSSDRVTYHNLKKFNSFVDVPAAVQRRDNCGGLGEDQCHRPLPVTKISFDQVVWKGDYGDKVGIYLTFSSAIPFLATASSYDGRFGMLPGLLSLCLETNVTVQNQRVHLVQCDDMKDFTFGPH